MLSQIAEEVSCKANYVRSVNPSGVLNISSADDANGVVPACIFSSKHLKLCRQAQLVEAD